MGIRVHKVMGWGLIDVVCENDKIKDPRFNVKSIIASDWEEREKWTMDGYLKWIKKEKKKKLNDVSYDICWEQSFLKENKKQHKIDFMDLFVHGIEYLDPTIFCCVPMVCYNHWRRYDDAMDYEFESHVRGKQENRVDLIKEAIYPWIEYWDTRDGRIIKSTYAYNLRCLVNSDKEYDLTHAAQLCGFENAEDAKNFMRPVVPEVVQRQLQFGEVFVEQKTVFDMVPMIYTYWS